MSSIVTTVKDYSMLARLAIQYVRKVRHLNIEEAHKLRADTANQMLSELGVTYDVENKEGLFIGRPCIYVANHTALIDSLVMCGCFPCDVRFLAKKELFSVPVLKTALKLEKHIPVFRGKDAKAHIESLKNSVAQSISEGASIMIFPEGTRSPTGKMGPFKLGAFYNAVQNQVPIVPIALEGLYKINPKTRKSFTPGHAVVHVLDPIEIPEGDNEQERVQKFADLAHDAIQKVMDSLEKTDD